MRFTKDHIAPTLHNAIGGVITLVILGVGGLLIALGKPFRHRAVEFISLSIPVWIPLLLLLAAALGWLLFLRTRRRLRSVEQQLTEAQSHPHRFRDDCTFDTRLGF